MKRANRNHDHNKKVKGFIIIVFTILFLIYGWIWVENTVKPSMTAIAEVKVKSIITELVNDSVREKFSEDIMIDDLLIISRNDSGQITMVQANTVLMTRISSDLTYLIKANFDNLAPNRIQVPLGTLFESQILSQTGPYVDMKVMPIGMTKVNIKTEFETQGINQTRYKIFLEGETQARVIVPFAVNDILVKNVVPIADVVIVGGVPDSYVVIPEDDVHELVD